MYHTYNTLQKGRLILNNPVFNQSVGYDLAPSRCRSWVLRVKVLPDEAFGLIHGKAGVITRTDGSRVCFIGSANESRTAWVSNYELVWLDESEEGVRWVQEDDS
ncbi:MAG: hypothetical protein KKC25_00395 [Proteobacteria bacterium]|nr:hypothetical protein [Pseudomonadota bacterium]